MPTGNIGNWTRHGPDLTAQLKQIDEQRRVLEDTRISLVLPALKMSFPEEILSNLKGVIDAVPIP